MNTVASVSVVIPCFRCVKTLERAVLSVVAQTVSPMEVILIDDASGDETRNLMKQLQTRSKPGWIRLVLLDVNVGAASARNAGWDQARGDYVAFLDADDAWHPRKIELQFGFMNSNPEVVVSGHQHRQVTADSAPLEDIGRVTFRPVSPRYILFKNPFVTPSFMVLRNVEVRFMAGRRFMEDHLFLMQIATAGGLVAKGETCLAYIFKPIYGQSGLSSHMYEMQCADVENYRYMNRIGKISLPAYFLFAMYSWVKYFKRLIVVLFEKLKSNHINS